MKPILIFSIDNKLYFHSSELIDNGRIHVVGKNGNLEKEILIHKCVYGSYLLNLNPGQYLIRITSDNERIEKQLYIGKENQVEENLEKKY